MRTATAPVAQREFGGTIRTLEVFEDNALVRATVRTTPGSGAVLVVDGGGSLRTALVGDLLAAFARDNGWSGIVLNGAVRDVETLARRSISASKRSVREPDEEREDRHGRDGSARHVRRRDLSPGRIPLRRRRRNSRERARADLKSARGFPKRKYTAFENAGAYFALVRRALGELVDGEHFFDAVDTGIVYEVLYEIPGWPRVIKGRTALMSAFRDYVDNIALDSADSSAVHVTDDGRVVVIEYEIRGTILETNGRMRTGFARSSRSKTGRSHIGETTWIR